MKQIHLWRKASAHKYLHIFCQHISS